MHLTFVDRQEEAGETPSDGFSPVSERIESTGRRLPRKQGKAEASGLTARGAMAPVPRACRHARPCQTGGAWGSKKGREGVRQGIVPAPQGRYMSAASKKKLESPGTSGRRQVGQSVDVSKGCADLAAGLGADGVAGSVGRRGGGDKTGNRLRRYPMERPGHTPWRSVLLVTGEKDGAITCGRLQWRFVSGPKRLPA
jgi:hypothetical protein